MDQRKFKPYGKVSALTLGGGGIGNIWGETSREEAVRTVRLAIENGINHFDVAPMYGRGEAEKVIGEAIKGRDIRDLHFTTKCSLGILPDNEVYDYLNSSLTRSLSSMGLEKVDLFLLHSQLIEDNHQLFRFNEFRNKNSTNLTSYFNAVIPAFEKLKKEGKISNWGIGLGQEEALIKAIDYHTPPNAIQCVVNILNSAGGIGFTTEGLDSNSILKECLDRDIPTLAIRAVQAGALTSSMDREPHPSGHDEKDFEDFEKAYLFRELAKKWDLSPSDLAHRYTLSVPGVSSVILGVKNRIELAECIKSEKNQLTDEEIAELEALYF
ncbi:aldo/keto reductase [Hyphomicrobiales bacterium]|jgi:aryl-alcohol dehydrogenase-like predicted oxidoreductase|nr:aldo/keto reductase [Hyphomicrobiales bacterium]MDB4247312.1 aldo/keto reductase [Hyphomicrobiales bacterium]|tara:strand:+ start:20 stop:994 length:975 start_codon:yes stop_codon:yes gene_type:complete